MNIKASTAMRHTPDHALPPFVVPMMIMFGTFLVGLLLGTLLLVIL